VSSYLLMLIVALIIVMIAFMIIGQPSKDRLYIENDIIRLQQNFISGGVQVIGTIVAIAILVLIVRQVNRVRS